MRTASALRVGALAVAAAMLAACGSGDDSNGSGGNQGSDDAGTPQSGGSASIVQLTEPRTLDPAAMTNGVVGNAAVGDSLYGHLLTIDEDGAPEYGLAEDLSTSDGGTTWTLTLRDGLTFSDGTPFDAAAVEFNWARLKDPATRSQSIGTATFIDTMTASGQTLEFTLTVPIAEFANAVAGALNWIASPQALQAGPQAFDENPIGAGPFVLQSWQRNGEMVLVRNEEYFDSPRPYLDELVLTANGDSEQRYSSLASGGVDAMAGSGPEYYARALDEGRNAATVELGGGNVFAFNVRIAPFDDVRARQAVVQAMDMDAVNAAAYSGEADMAETLFVDDSPYNGDSEQLPYDAEAAQELFDELADEGRAVEFTLTAYQTTESRRISEALQAQLSQYDNVSVELEILDFPAATALVAQRTFQMIPSGLVFQNPAPTVYSYLHSESSGNISGISDPELDAAVLEGLGATDEQAREEAYQEVAARFAELAPVLFTSRGTWSLIYGDRLQGVEMYAAAQTTFRTDTLWVSD